MFATALRLVLAQFFGDIVNNEDFKLGEISAVLHFVLPPVCPSKLT